MNKENYAVGLDIGTTKIVAMVGKKNEYGKLEILGVGNAKSLGVKRGVVNNITQTIQSIQEAVRIAEQKSGCEIKDVVVGIAGQHIRSIQHQEYITRENPDSIISEEDIETLISQVQRLTMLPGEEIIHVLPQEFKVDDQTGIKEPIGLCGRRLEASFHVVVGQSSSIRNVGRCVKDAGFELAGLTLEPLASADAVLSEEEKEAGVALIDIGGGTTDLAIFKDGIIRHTAVIPFGGNVITEDIKEGCSIIEKYAEILKVRFGSTWPGENKENELVSIPGIRGNEPKEISVKNLSKIIHARVVEIIDMVFAEIKDYGYENPKKKLIAGIVLTGGGSELRHIKQLVEYQTGISTRIGFPGENLAAETDSDITRPIYSTGVGLTMESLLKKQCSSSPIEDNSESNMASTAIESVSNFDVHKIESGDANTFSQEDGANNIEKEEEKKSTFSKISERFIDGFYNKINNFLNNG